MAKRILICDDDSDILSICTYILEEQGWEVYTRTHCNDIIDVISDFKPQVILMDNWIPETGGIKATQAIKEVEEFKKIPVIYFSANNDIKSLAEQAGADTFLAKPFDIDELGRVIDSVVAEQDLN